MCHEDVLVEFYIAFFFSHTVTWKRNPKSQNVFGEVAEVETELLKELNEKLYADFIRIN